MRLQTAAVYRRRRLAALGVLSALIVLVIVWVASCGSDDKPGVARSASGKPLILSLPRGGRRLFPDYRVVAYYGAPQDAQLGQLGIGTPAQAGRKLLLQAAEAMRLSARGYTRILRVARTVADMAGAQTVGRIHVAEALSYRRMPARA